MAGPTFTQDGITYEDLGNGQVRVVGYAAAPSSTVVAPNPVRAAKEAQEAAREAANDASTNSDREADNVRADASLALQQQTAASMNELRQIQIQAEREKAQQGQAKRTTLDALVKQVNRVQSLYESNVQGFNWNIPAIGVAAPNEANSQFDTAGTQLSSLGLAAFRVPGTGTVSDRDAIMFDRANLPSADKYDSSIEEQLRGIRSRVESEYGAMGLPAPKWGEADGQQAEDELDKVAAVADTSPDGLPPAGQGGNDPRTPWDGPGAGRQVASRGTRIVEHPEIASLAYSLVRSGAGFATVQSALAKKGATLTMAQFADAQKRLKAKPEVNPFISQTEVPTTFMQRAASHPGGAALLGASNAFTLGGIDEITGGINSVVNGTSYDDERDIAQGAKEAASAANPGSYMGGQVLGGLTSGLLGGALVGGGTKAAAALSSLPGALGAGATYGAVSGALEDNDNRLSGALLGGGLGLAGGGLGRYVGAPIAERIGRFRGNAPQIAPQEMALPNVPPSVMDNLSDASRLGLPYALADADPALQMLAGTVTRKSPNARTLAEAVLEPRSRGQAERAFDAIDTHLAPVTDLAERSAQWRQAAQTASAPHYAAMRGHSAPMDPQVNAMLDTPVGKAALRDARTIAANEGRNPNEMGFVELENGDVIFGENPSWETLDFVKRGIDQQLSPYRNQLTGKLVLEGNPQAQAIEGFRQRFVSTLDNLNGDYKNARASYQGEIQNRDALQRGTKLMAPQVRPRELPPILDGFDERQIGEVRRGAATNMADTVNNVQLSGNPYNRVFGTPAQQEKVGTLFPEGAADFARVYGLERDMSKTVQETLGGSPTAARLAADQQLGGLGAGVVDAGSQLLTGGGVPAASLFNLGKRTLADAAKLGLGKQAQARAEKLAPTLFDTDPQAALDYLLDLSARKMAMKQRKQDYGSKGALLGALISPALLPSN